MPQHAFRSKDHQRFAPDSQRLPAQKVEVLRSRGRLADLEIVHGSELQKPLDASARMLRPLAFVAVRQQKDETREKIPFGFAGHDELIDDRLRNVGEVPELCLPKNQRLRKVATVA